MVPHFEPLDPRLFLSIAPAISPISGAEPNIHASAKVAALFAKAVSTSTNFASPDSVAVADFNGDKKMDAVEVDTVGVQLLLGNGDGTFQAPKTIAHGTTLSSVRIGDFNGDGKPDIVVVGSKVAVYLNEGKTFTRTLNIKTGGTPQNVLVGDFNKDKTLDLAVANLGSNTVSILLGTGTGTFSAPTSFSAGNGPAYIAAGDFNGDHRIDLAVADTGQLSLDIGQPVFGPGAGLSILTGNGHGSFHSPKFTSLTGRPTGVIAADLSGDGKLDLAVALGGLAAPDGANDVAVLTGIGNATFSAPAFYRTGADPQTVQIGDFNHDGSTDLVTANFNADSVSVLLNKGGGTFAATQNYGTGGGPGQLVVADLNKDKKSDLLVADFNDDELSTLLATQ